jgi:RNA polymerase sigma factor (sigma-70 family)
MNDPDSVLLDRWFSNHDSHAFHALVTRYSGMVYATCRRVLANATDAEDAAQECFEALATSRNVPPKYLGPWLHRVATNRALNHIRADTRRRNRDTAYAVDATRETEPTWADIYVHIDEAISALPDELRVPLVQVFLEGRTQLEVADSIGVARKTVAYRVEKAVESIQETLRSREILVLAATLGAMLSANLGSAETLPQSLITKLGKLALTGANNQRPAPSRGAKVVQKNVAAIAIAVCALSVIAFTAYQLTSQRDPAAVDATRAESTPTVQTPAGQIAARMSTAAAETSTPVGATVAAAAPTPVDDSIYGRIVDEATGEGRNLGIKFSGEANHGNETAYPTAIDGSFRIAGNGIGYGTFSISVKSYNFFPFPVVEGVRRRGQPTPEVIIRVAELARISGRVTLADGSSAPDASIMRVILGQNSDTVAITGTNGKYDVHHDGGRWQIWARVGLLRTEQVTLELSPGESVVQDFVMPDGGGLTIDLVPSDGGEVIDISKSILMTSSMTAPYLIAEQLKRNCFQVNFLPYDSYSIEFRAEGYAASQVNGITISETSPSAHVTVALQLAQLHNLTVRVIETDGKAVPNVLVTLEELSQRGDSNGAVQAEINTPVAINGINTDANGEWIAERLRAGVYRAVCYDDRGSGSVIVEVPATGAADLVLDPGKRPVRMNLTLVDAKTGKELLPFRCQKFLVDSGGALAADLSPGQKYTLIIAKDGYTAYVGEVDVPIDVPPNGIDVRAEFGNGGVISGVVESNDAESVISRVYVCPEALWPFAQAQWNDPWQTMCSALAQGVRTETSGAFSIGLLPPGNYVVAQSGSCFSVPVRVEAGSETSGVTLRSVEDLTTQ